MPIWRVGFTLACFIPKCLCLQPDSTKFYLNDWPFWIFIGSLASSQFPETSVILFFIRFSRIFFYHPKGELMYNFRFLSFSFHLPFLFKLAWCSNKYFPFLQGVIKKLHVSMIKAVIFCIISFKIVGGYNTFSQRILFTMVFTDSIHLHYRDASFCSLIPSIVLITSFSFFFPLCTLFKKCHRKVLYKKMVKSFLTPKRFVVFHLWQSFRVLIGK